MLLQARSNLYAERSPAGSKSLSAKRLVGETSVLHSNSRCLFLIVSTYLSFDVHVSKMYKALTDCRNYF